MMRPLIRVTLYDATSENDCTLLEEGGEYFVNFGDRTGTYREFLRMILLFGGLSSPLALTDHGFDENVQKYHALAGGYGVAGFATTPQPGEAAVVIGNSGHTIVNGFFLEDATSPADAVRFAQNQIEFLINPRLPIQLLSLALAAGQFQVSLSGSAGTACSFQSSSNLTQWTSLTNLTLSASPAVLTVPITGGANFFRAVTPPAP